VPEITASLLTVQFIHTVELATAAHSTQVRKGKAMSHVTRLASAD
jgi:hypothetical protein